MKCRCTREIKDLALTYVETRREWRIILANIFEAVAIFIPGKGTRDPDDHSFQVQKHQDFILRPG